MAAMDTTRSIAVQILNDAALCPEPAQKVSTVNFKKNSSYTMNVAR